MSSSPSNGTGGSGHRGPVTLRTLGRMARAGECFACLAVYDATTARWMERAGVHLLLMGDSAAETVLGFTRTTHMPLEVSIHLTAGVKRGAPNTVVMADMPFMSYHGSPDDAVLNAGRFMTEGLADIVKLEVDRSFEPLVARLASAGIPVCAHIGSRPQTAALTGGYSAAGRTVAEAERIIEAAGAFERAGAGMILVEAVPDEVGAAIVERVSVPVIGIGAGPSPHGQILVVNDLLGLTDHPPRFADPVAAFGPELRRAGEAWVRRVSERSIGGQGYRMLEGESLGGHPAARSV